MSAVSSSPSDAPFELKNATLTLLAFVLRTTDLERLAAALDDEFGINPAVFDHDPVVIDLGAVQADPTPLDFTALAALLRARRMLPVGVERGSEAQMQAALAAGLGDAATLPVPNRAGPPPNAQQPTTDDASADRKAAAASPFADDQGPGAAASHEADGNGSALTESTASRAAASRSNDAAETRATLVIDRPLRSGQQVYARGADLVVLAAVNFGAEVIADGHIHVYAPLRGRAIAGARGNTAARIFSTCMEPQLVSIAGTYRTLEKALPEQVHGRPAQVRLEGDAILVEALAS